MEICSWMSMAVKKMLVCPPPSCRFVFCDFPRSSVSSDIQCRRYIRGFSLRISFICASNQNPTRLTMEKVIFSCRMQFCLVYAKNRQVMFGSVFCDFQRLKIRSVSSDPASGVKCRRYIRGFILRNSFICASNQ